jgi:diadenosine tetraphosphate (Ap4A) HIT family hydrolase
MQTCPFEGPLIVRPLASLVLPEPARRGEGGRPCPNCEEGDASYLWTDDNWRVRIKCPTSLPGSVILETRDHYDSFTDLPEAHISAFGPLLARLEAAILGLEGVARVHTARWGDGASHFHVNLYPRPYGQLQLRGTFMEIWEMLLPPAPLDSIREAGCSIGKSLRQSSPLIID